MRKVVSVVGLGYVGLPLALALQESGYQVFGIDTSERRLAYLRGGVQNSPEVSHETSNRPIVNHEIALASTFDSIRKSDFVVICVPTPLSENSQLPDLSAVIEAASQIAAKIKSGATVILESTVAPGTTDGLVREIFERANLELDRDFYLGYSPERIDPGPAAPKLRDVPKLVSGCSRKSLDVIAEFYLTIVDNVVRLSSCSEAEFAKTLENSYRLVNISLVNELALAAEKMGINFGSVVNAAATKPYGFHPFFPGLGAGGHCIPVDPVYLSNEIQSRTQEKSELLDMALLLNNEMPRKVARLLELRSGPLRGKKVLLFGLTYKPGVADLRNSPSIELAEEMINVGAELYLYDELVSAAEIQGKLLYSISLESTKYNFDLVVLAHCPKPEVLEQIEKLSNVIFFAHGTFEFRSVNASDPIVAEHRK